MRLYSLRSPPQRCSHQRSRSEAHQLHHGPAALSAALFGDCLEFAGFARTLDSQDSTGSSDSRDSVSLRDSRDSMGLLGGCSQDLPGLQDSMESSEAAVVPEVSLGNTPVSDRGTMGGVRGCVHMC